MYFLEDGTVPKSIDNIKNKEKEKLLPFSFLEKKISFCLDIDLPLMNCNQRNEPYWKEFFLLDFFFTFSHQHQLLIHGANWNNHPT